MQTEDCGTSQPPEPHEPIPRKKSLPIFIYTMGSVTLEKPDTSTNPYLGLSQSSFNYIKCLQETDPSKKF